MTGAAPAESPPGSIPAPSAQGTPPPAPPAVIEACPLCGGPLDPRQDWCLSCGAAARTRLAATPNWKGPVAAIAAVAVLALGVLAAALVKLAGDSGSSTTPATTTITTAPAASAPVTAAPAAPTTTPGVSTPSTTASTPTVTAQPGNAGGLAGPSTAPTVTAKAGTPGKTKLPGTTGTGKSTTGKSKFLESLPPSERKAIEERLKSGGGKTSGR